MSGHNDVDRLALFAAAKCCADLFGCGIAKVGRAAKLTNLARAALLYRKRGPRRIWSQHSRQLDNLLGALGNAALNPAINILLSPGIARLAKLDWSGKLAGFPHPP
jgi:hypothetical protein